jgi:hypothetical protein
MRLQIRHQQAREPILVLGLPAAFRVPQKDVRCLIQDRAYAGIGLCIRRYGENRRAKISNVGLENAHGSLTQFPVSRGPQGRPLERQVMHPPVPCRTLRLLPTPV